jgi:prepilin-type N-terminal cleavage/methylation domain-containing protein
MKTRRAAAPDRGFTLVEMLITIILLGVVSTAVAASLFFGIRATSDSHSRIDQSLAEMGVTRFLSSDIYAAEGAVALKGTDASCGAYALKLMSRSDATKSAPDTTVVWVLMGTDLVRTTCVGGKQIDTFVVSKGVSVFSPSCTTPCTTVSVAFTAAASGAVKPTSWTLSVGRRGVTS